jgi:N-formylglutamate amidohydrolase
MEFHDFLVKFVNELLVALLPVLAASLVGLAIQGLRYLQAEIKLKQQNVYNQLDWFVRQAVYAAEQAGVAGLIENKKQFAIDFINRELEARGLGSIDEKMIADKVEAAVYEEINKSKLDQIQSFEVRQSFGR